MATLKKTPISVLNELTVKCDINIAGHCIENPPDPSAVEPTMRSSSREFRYEYRIKNYSAQATGTSKKRAQHKAAERLIEILKESPEYGSLLSDYTTLLASPSEVTVDKDAIGPLTDFCKELSLPPPEFCSVREEGPAHDRRYTSRCIMPSHSVEATNRQKKQAKQLVALKMLTTLRSTMESRVNHEIKLAVDDTRSDDWEETMKKFPHCGRSFNTKFHSQNVSGPLLFNLSRFENHRRKLKEVVDQFTPLETDCPEEALDSILHELDIGYSLVHVACECSDKDCLIVLNIQFNPDLILSEISTSFVDASRRVIRKALNYIRILCSSFPAETEETSPLVETEGTTPPTKIEGALTSGKTEETSPLVDVGDGLELKLSA